MVGLWSEQSSLFNIFNPIIRAQWLLLTRTKSTVSSTDMLLSWSTLYPPAPLPEIKLMHTSRQPQCFCLLFLHTVVTHDKKREPPESSCLKCVKWLHFCCVVAHGDVYLVCSSNYFCSRIAAEGCLFWVFLLGMHWSNYLRCPTALVRTSERMM